MLRRRLFGICKREWLIFCKWKASPVTGWSPPLPPLIAVDATRRFSTLAIKDVPLELSIAMDDSSELPMTNLLKDFLKHELALQTTPLDVEDCRKLRQKLLAHVKDQFRIAPERVIDSSLLKILWINRDIEHGISYVNFLLQSGLLNPACVILASTFIRERFYCCDGFAETDDLAIKFFSSATTAVASQIIRKKLESSFYLALGCSSRWKEAREWFAQRNEYKYNGLFDVLIKAAFEQNEPSIGFELLASFHRLPSDVALNRFAHRAILRHINTILDHPSAKNETKALKVIDSYVDAAHQCYSTKSCLDKSNLALLETIMSRFSSQRWSSSVTKVSNGDSCSGCGLRLESLALSQEEFDSMKKMILDKLIDVKNVYRWSNPKEFQRVNELLNRGKPFDVVVDGLNVIYTRRTEGLKSMRLLLSTLQRDTTLPTKNILVFLRPPRNAKEQGMVDELKHLATIFNCNFDTADDSYMLLAALHSGPNCFLLTNDFLRAQNQLLPPVGASLFQRWRRLRQIYYEYTNNRFKLQLPNDDAACPQKDAEGYHMPLLVEKEDNSIIFDSRIPTVTEWLCVRRCTNDKSSNA